MDSRGFQPIGRQYGCGDRVIFSGKGNSTIVCSSLVAFRVRIGRVLRRNRNFFIKGGSNIQVDLRRIYSINYVVQFRVLCSRVVQFSIARGFLSVVGPFIDGVYVCHVRGHGFFIRSRVKIMKRTIQRFMLTFGGIGLVVVGTCVFSNVYSFRRQFLFSFCNKFVCVLRILFISWL